MKYEFLLDSISFCDLCGTMGTGIISINLKSKKICYSLLQLCHPYLRTNVLKKKDV